MKCHMVKLSFTCMAQVYRPAIAPEVLGSLFDYFTKQKQFTCISSITNDYTHGTQPQWDSLVSDLTLPDNRIDCVWQLALAIDDILRADIKTTCKYFKMSCTELTHGNVIPELLEKYWAIGHHYISFTIVVTILERALYDLYAQLNQSQKPNMILRDLLQTPELKNTLPNGLLLLLHVLFFPSGLNLRNLVWHGFVAPVDMPGCFSSLLIVILSDPVFRRTTTNEVCIYASLPKFPPAVDNICVETQKVIANCDIEKCFQDQPIQAKSRCGLVQLAINAFQDGNSILSMFLSIPVLEYLIRCEFVRVNPSAPKAMAEAQLSEYYSTLDGFGQRNQHQVLLAREIIHSTEQNRLYDTMNLGSLNACIDLFMCAAGPNIRAKLCHGELNLEALLFYEKTTQQQKICASLVLLLIIQLLQHDVVISPLELYSSQFHPYAMIQAQLTVCCSDLQSFRLLLQNDFQYNIDDLGENICRMVFQTSSDKILSITESSSRMISMPPSTSTPSGIENLSHLIHEYIEWFAVENSSVYLWLKGGKYTSILPPLNLRTFGDNIPSATCLQAILQAAQRHIQSYSQKLIELKSMLTYRTARTSHRRTLITCVLFQSCFEQMIALIIAMVNLSVFQCTQGQLTRAMEDVPSKLLQFIVFDDDKKSMEKLLQMANQFWSSKAIRRGFFKL
ncbi:hypothetical protein THRCLA_01320 [Thraustotheca clavata]|uniref:DUF4209 domain-containing protein n=1 Tax=Thraustotheca clavata TaxID=74557 RepID=A0A1W0A8M2_9STRA|nr:hypothetical protein THRCLA_01320 [Thraustotheca clavata]